MTSSRFLTTLIFSLFFVATISAQARISGRVMDSLNHAPIPFATVYFDGTTVGEVTDEAGRFSLPLDDIELPAALAVTHLNYRPGGTMVSAVDAELVFYLSDRAVEIETVEVADRNQRGENLAEFRRSFLGDNDWGKRARIRNEDRLVFDRTYATHTMKNADLIVARHGLPDNLRNVQWSLDGKSLTYEQAVDLRANSRSPLLLDLPDLGYRLQVDLHRFVTNYRAGSTHHLSTYYFQPYEGSNGKARKRHLRNRRSAYYNSAQHFLRALYHGVLDAEGYQIFEKVNGNFSPFALSSYLHEREDGGKELRGLKDREIVIAYYYDNQGAPLRPGKRRGGPYRTSYLYVFSETEPLRADGTLGDSSLSFGGAIGQRGVAMLLPSDYVPGE